MKTVAFSIIEAAKQYDYEAVEFIRQHFESYITSKCLITYVDQYGNVKNIVDDELRYHAENAMLSAIFTFQFREPPAGFYV